MSASDHFKTAEKLAMRLHKLRAKRMDKKAKLRETVSRKSLSVEQRKQIYSKTAGRCHLCGGKIKAKDPWSADHVVPHSEGGMHVDNYLPAHPTCNGYRKAYGSEEFQWIMKLDVWLRTQIEKETDLGKPAAEAFCKHDKKRAGRRVK